MINYKDIKLIRFYDILSILLLSTWINLITSESFNFSPLLLLKLGKYGYSLYFIISFVFFTSELRDSLEDVRRSEKACENDAYLISLDSKKKKINTLVTHIFLGLCLFIIFEALLVWI